MIDKFDPDFTNRMFADLKIKPSKTIRKTYQEYSFSPILYKFWTEIGIKDVNVINQHLKDGVVIKYLMSNWGRYDRDTGTIEFGSKEMIFSFFRESLGFMTEKAAIKTLLKSLEFCYKKVNKNSDVGYDCTYFSSPNHQIFNDTINMMQSAWPYLDAEVKKEILKEGITKHLHDNLVNFCRNLKIGDRYAVFENTDELRVFEWETKKDDYSRIYRFVIPENENELSQWGSKFHNCVGWGGYGSRIKSGETAVVGCFSGSTPVACIEVSPTKKLQQAWAPCNKALSGEAREVVIDWCELKFINYKDCYSLKK